MTSLPFQRVSFSFQSKDRLAYTRESILSILGADGFDLIWTDGSTEPDVPNLACQLQSDCPHRIRSLEFGITGGPDRAIIHALREQLDLGYDWVGLIENDVVCHPGWFDTLRRTIELAHADGIPVGAASIRGYRSRVLEYRRGYSIDWACGAGMVLFTRDAAQLILDNYPSCALSIRAIYSAVAQRFHRRIISPEWLLAHPDTVVTSDYGYSTLLYSHGLYSVGSIPSFAHDLQFDVHHFLNTSYVTRAQDNSGSPWMGT